MKHDYQSMKEESALKTGRREFARLTMGTLAGVTLGQASVRGEAAATTPPRFLTSLRGRPITIAMLVFERMDQIDFTGPFSVLARVPEARIQVVGLTNAPVRDHKRLILTPQIALNEAGQPDVLVVPGGPGQEALMEHRDLLDFIAAQQHEGRALFSVCTGALLCGAAGVLRGRRATTHWSALSLLGHFGAITAKERVVVDGDLVTSAGVTAGIDGALTLAALVRGENVAQQIQLDIQYAPEPPFQAGNPETAPPDVLAAVTARYRPLTEARAATARRLGK
ncbi:DJ-1/PfpI family protein [Verrucomicrobium sp. BvORR034]|uniref:DJ-1/PfpI family protein n=1 Tax=Verrucomicrobium sp. BvORR034 TaxID=1396418 RepID=UPI000AD58858|nr:DJ-1/PfpI family protein [Verrucomicrobium sp. BvORR034]